MDKNKEIYNNAITFFEKGLLAIPEENIDAYSKDLKGLKEAGGMANTEEEWAYLTFAAVRAASTLAFKLFRIKELKGDLQELFMSLPTPEEAVKEAQEFNEAHKKESEELIKAQEKFNEAASKRDLFMAVCNGTPLKEAKQHQEEMRNAVQGR